ncbi:MAG: hypothetical protein ACYC6L_12665, partial [Anaerolineae bacterium]
PFEPGSSPYDGSVGRPTRCRRAWRTAVASSKRVSFPPDSHGLCQAAVVNSLGCTAGMPVRCAPFVHSCNPGRALWLPINLPCDKV